MNSSTDIRDKASLTGNEVRQLNFISDLPVCQLRKHYRQGLRSHIFEVLAVDDILKETKGEFINGTRWFPIAVPKHMLRILRTRFTTLDQVLAEVKKYALLLKFLGPDLIARSEEFIVEYTGTEKNQIVLCGLQEYVEGTILDPWGLFNQAPLDTFYQAGEASKKPERNRVSRALESIATFVRQTQKMITDAGYIPDLAGNGNLILTTGGGIKLVDINNIIRIDQNDTILLDDKSYPSCDKSVEVLAILEQKILKTESLPHNALYGHFLSAERKKRVRKLEEKFYQSFSASPAKANYPFNR